jgi:hypothetical protein
MPNWVDIPDLAQGLNLDAAPEDLAPGVATGGQNVRFRSGYAEKARGILNVYTTPLVTPYHITHYTVGTTRFVVYAGIQKTYVDDGSTQTDITNANNTGAIDDRYTGGIFNGVYIQNNGVDVPQYWGGNTANNLANLTAWPSGWKCGFLRPFKNKLVGGDLTRGGVRERGTFFWSHTADPGTIPDSWDITDATKDAADQPLAETNGTLIDCLPLGDLLVIYKDDAIHFAQEVQNSQIFRFGRFPGNTGLLFRGCVVQTPMGHVFLTPGFDVVLFNGQGEPQSILEGSNRTYLATAINSDYAKRAFLATNPATNEVLVCFPSGSSQVCDKALVWNWRDNKWWRRDLTGVTYGSTGQVSLTNSEAWSGDSGSWATDTTSWSSLDYAPNSPRLIFTRNAPALSMFDALSQDYGADFSQTWEQVGISFDSPDRKKWPRATRIRFEGPQGSTVSVQWGSASAPDSSPNWGNAVTHTVGTDHIIHPTCDAGYFLALRYTSTANVRVRHASVDLVDAGAY